MTCHVSFSRRLLLWCLWRLLLFLGAERERSNQSIHRPAPPTRAVQPPSGSSFLPENATGRRSSDGRVVCRRPIVSVGLECGHRCRSSFMTVLRLCKWQSRAWNGRPGVGMYDVPCRPSPLSVQPGTWRTHCPTSTSVKVLYIIKTHDRSYLAGLHQLEGANNTGTVRGQGNMTLSGLDQSSGRGVIIDPRVRIILTIP